MDLPGIRQILELPLLSSALAGFLPQLVLRLFFSLMPYILAALEHVEGLPAESEVEFGVVRKYFAFQVIPTNMNHHYSSWPPESLDASHYNFHAGAENNLHIVLQGSVLNQAQLSMQGSAES